MVTASPRSALGPFRSGTLLGLALLLWASQPAAAEEAWLKKAQTAEKAGRWGEACRLYDEWSRQARHNPSARQGYQRCLRRLQLTHRHADSLYRQSLKKLTTPQALDVYDQVLGILTIAYPDRTRTTLPLLFQQGLQEVRFALDAPAFLKEYFPGAKSRAVGALKSRLAAWDTRPVATRADARNQALALLQLAPRDVGTLRGPAMAALILELAAGACASLDEHSAFLTPGLLAVMQATVRGDLVSVGVDLGPVSKKDGLMVQVTRVHPNGPSVNELREKDVILKVAGRVVKGLAADEVAALLRGRSGQKVELEVERAGTAAPQKVTLTRRAVALTSVDARRGSLTDMETSHLMLKDGRALGYIKIHHFQSSTAQEVKDKLAAMMAESPDPIKGLILDLRGNPGGLFRSAISVAEQFLSDAVIVVGQSPLPEYNKSFKSASASPNLLPVVVLIDAETASAAEVLAGALKEARRAPTRVMGQTTYGKGSIQCLIPLEKTALGAPAGIRLTVAKLLSPTNQGYTDRGVTPDVPSDLEGDALEDEAVKKLGEMLNSGMGMGMAVAMGSDER